jgi:hypothetical protein
MNGPEYRRGFTRIDLSVGLVIALACLSVLLPACSKSANTERQKEDEDNLRELGEGTHKMFDQMPGNHRIRVAAARTASTSNLKQMGISVENIASVYNGLLPPATGQFPANGPDSTIFFHMLPYIEQNNAYQAYRDNPKAIPDSMAIKVFCSPCDPSIDAKSALCSYAANAAVFGTTNGGSTRYPAQFLNKGTSNTILFVEHYAKPVVNADGGTVSNYWYSPSTALYPAAGNFQNPNAWQAIKNAQFDVPYDGDDPRPDNSTAQGFLTKTMTVGLADGSTRVLTKDVTKIVTFPVGNDRLRASAWQWACCVSGTLNDAPTPEGW